MDLFLFLARPQPFAPAGRGGVVPRRERAANGRKRGPPFAGARHGSHPPPELGRDLPERAVCRGRDAELPVHRPAGREDDGLVCGCPRREGAGQAGVCLRRRPGGRRSARPDGHYVWRAGDGRERVRLHLAVAGRDHAVSRGLVGGRRRVPSLGEAAVMVQERPCAEAVPEGPAPAGDRPLGVESRPVDGSRAAGRAFRRGDWRRVRARLVLVAHAELRHLLSGLLAAARGGGGLPRHGGAPAQAGRLRDGVRERDQPGHG